MAYEVRLTNDAAVDLEELYRFVAQHDSIENAEKILSGVEYALKSLSRSPARGTYPPELADIGVREYRQVFFKPYRIIYRTISRTVYIYLIVDGRRDMQTLLRQRLLRA